MQEQQTPIWASPTAAVLYAAAVAATVMFSSLTGLVSPAATPLIAVWLIAAAVLMVVAGIIEFRRGDMFGGTLDLVFGCFLTLAPGLGNLIQSWGMSAEVPIDLRVNGWGLLLCGVVFLAVVIPSGRAAPWIMSLGLLDLGIALIMIGLAIIGVLGLAILPACGWMILAFVCIAIYVATGILTNTTFGKPILPLGRPLAK